MQALFGARMSVGTARCGHRSRCGRRELVTRAEAEDAIGAATCYLPSPLPRRVFFFELLPPVTPRVTPLFSAKKELLPPVGVTPRVTLGVQ